MLRTQRQLTGVYAAVGGEDHTEPVPPGDYRFPFIQVDDPLSTDGITRPFCDQAHQMLGRAGSPSFTLTMVETTTHAVTNARRKRLRLRIGVLVLTLVFLAVLVQGVHLVSPKSIETAISQNLGPKSDVTSVRHFMDAHQILYTGYSPEFRRLYGKIYGSSIGLMKGHILVEFNFNEEGKLVSHKVVELFEFAWK